MLLLIDNYDSFTYNLWHYFGEMGLIVDVARTDVLTSSDAMAFHLECPHRSGRWLWEAFQGRRRKIDLPAAAG